MKYLTPKQVSKTANVGIDLVLHWINSEALPASNISRGTKRPRWRVEESDLKTFLDGRQKKTPQKRAERRRRVEVPQYV